MNALSELAAAPPTECHESPSASATRAAVTTGRLPTAMTPSIPGAVGDARTARVYDSGS